MSATPAAPTKKTKSVEKLQGIVPDTYLGDAFELIDPVCKVEDEGAWAVISWNRVRTLRHLFHIPAGTEAFLQLDVGPQRFILFNNQSCETTIVEVPLAEVMFPELGIQYRDEAISAVRKFIRRPITKGVSRTILPAEWARFPQLEKALHELEDFEQQCAPALVTTVE